MKLAELMMLYEERARVASAVSSNAPVASVYRLVIGELSNLDGIETAGRWMPTGEAAGVLGVSTKTIRKWCVEGRFPNARKTSGNSGEWRIPVAEVYENTGRPLGRRVTIPKLWRADDG